MGEDTPVYHEQLGESLKGHEGLAGVADVNDLAQKYIDLGVSHKSLQGASEGMVTIPGENTSDTDRSAFYLKTGRPESYDKYEFDKIEMPEGREVDKVLDEAIRKVAFDNGVSSKALRSLQSAVVKHGVTQANEVARLIKEQNDKDTNALKDIWQGDAFKENTEKAERTFKAIVEKLDVPETLGGKEGMIEEFKVMGFLDDSNPKFRYFMAKMFNLIGDDSFIEGLGSSGEPKETKKTDSGYSMLSFPSMEGKK